MDFSEFEEKYLHRLNPQQREAVLAVDGPVLLLATPGSGKTTVLVIRLGYMLLCRGISPASVLTMTYTRAAARDMRSRFASLFGEQLASRVSFRTINGISASIISMAASRHGRVAFSLLEDGSRNGILRELYRELFEDYPEDSTIRELATSITYIKNMMLTDEEIETRKWPVSRLPELYRRYQAELRARRAMDYDDQMVYALRLLRRFPDLLDALQNQFRYFCVDEAQDTSKVQHEIIRLLASRSDHLFMVGDEDQSIYSFRAAWPEALISFPSMHPGARLLLIEENYRSTPEIIAAANGFIAKNRFRHPKAMRPVRPDGSAVHLLPVDGRKSQYDWLFQHARELTRDDAILFRNNDSALLLIDHFERCKISYRCRNYEDNFFSHRVVIDFLDILRFALHPDDAEAFLRIYYKLGAGITSAAARQAVLLASSGRDKNPFRALLTLRDLKPGVRDAVSRILYSFNRIPSDAAGRALQRIWEDLRFGRYVEQHGLDSGKYFILSALADEAASIPLFLEKLERLRDLISSHENKSGPVFSTVHSSKGLEYGRVFLLDMLDGILPSVPAQRAKSEEEIAVYEEERRLFYVAMTRARDELFVFLTPGNTSFPRELAKSLPLSLPEKKNIFSFLQLPLPIVSSHSARDPKPDVPSFLAKNGVGSRVVHKRFGPGTVLSVSGDLISISFDDEGKKTLSLSAAIPNALLRSGSDE